MPKTISLQSSFNAGVLDPRLASRVDVDKYYSGLATGKNVVCTPQGGIKRRPGMSWIADVSIYNNVYEGILLNFSFNTEQNYLLHFVVGLILVYKDDVLQAAINTGYLSGIEPELYFVQSADTLIVCHEDYAPRALVRGSSHTSWTWGAIGLTNIPQYDFNDPLSPSTTDEVQRVTFPVGWTTEQFTLDLGGTKTASIQYSIVVATTAANIQAALRALANTSATGITVAHVSGQDYDVTFGGDDSGYDWPDMIGAPVSPATGTITVAEQTKGAGIDEDVWSTSRGWPKSVTFHEGRLWFGGSKSRPQTIWGSKSNDFYNFDIGASLDDEAVIATLDTDEVNAITAIYSNRHLQIFTTGGEFYMAERPITPTNISVQRQSLNGSANIKPVSIDGATLFIERRGKAVREFVFSYTEDAYTASPVSIMAPHLINSPVSMAARKGTASDDANLVYIVNGDGTMAVLNTLRSENVLGWTEWETAGTVISVAVVGDDTYVLVKRDIDGTDYYFIEKLDADTYTDANVAKTQASSTTVTGLDHLDGELCRVKADDAIMADATPSGGSITLARAATEIEVGLNFDVDITTMPLNVSFANGPTLFRKKRPYHVQLDVYESNGIVVNGSRIPDKPLGGVLPTVPAPYTGMKETWLNGWSEIADVTITQPDPLPLFIRSINVNLEVN